MLNKEATAKNIAATILTGLGLSASGLTTGAEIGAVLADSKRIAKSISSIDQAQNLSPKLKNRALKMYESIHSHEFYPEGSLKNVARKLIKD